MVWKTDGSPHSGGIKNEGDLKTALEKNPNMFGHEDVHGPIIEVEMKAGTKHKDDLRMLFANGVTCRISAKRWSGGTHDWCNDSKTVNELRRESPIIDQLVRDTHTLVEGDLEERNAKGKIVVVEKQRVRAAKAGFKQLQWIEENPESFNLKHYIKTQFEKIRGQEVILNDVENKQWVYYKAEDHPIFDKIDDPNWVPVLNINPTEKHPFPTSANIEGTGLRFRAVTNNGITPMFGLSKANNYTQSVFKIQQSVSKLLATMEEQGKLKRVSYEG